MKTDLYSQCTGNVCQALRPSWTGMIHGKDPDTCEEIILLKKKKKKVGGEVKIMTRKMDVRGNRVNSRSLWEIRKNCFIFISEHLKSKALSKQGTR